jgi:hypothetical protein
MKKIDLQDILISLIGGYFYEDSNGDVYFSLMEDCNIDEELAEKMKPFLTTTYNN